MITVQDNPIILRLLAKAQSMSNMKKLSKDREPDTLVTPKQALVLS
jgi:hypothetical protein